MNLRVNNIVNYISILIVCLCIGYIVRIVIKNENAKREEWIIKIALNNYLQRHTDLTLELNSKTVKLDFSNISDKQKVNNLLSEYILNTYALYEELYQFILENELIIKNIEKYEFAYSILYGIYESQTQAYKSIDDILLKSSITPSIFITESKHNLEISEKLTKVVCEDVLKIDPANKDAIETLVKLGVTY